MRPTYNVFKMTTGVSLLFGIAVLGACSHDDLQEANAPKTDDFVSVNPHHVAADDAVASLHNFMDNGSETRTVTPEISGIEVLRWGDVAMETATRSADPEMPADEPLAYIMNFEGGGYAIVGADERQGGVVAMVEQGRMSASTLASAKHEAANSKDGAISLATYVNSNVVTCLEDLVADARIVPPPTGPGWGYGPVEGIIEYRAPMLKTKWTQRAPYNKYCSERLGRTVPVGCVAQTLVQIMAYNKKQYGVGPGTISDVYRTASPARIGSGGGTDWYIGFYWSDITAAIGSPTPQTPGQWEAVGRFLDAVGWAIHMDYEERWSTASDENAAMLLKNQAGYKNVQVKKAIVNDIRTTVYLNNLPLYVVGDGGKNVVISTGPLAYGNRHVWVVDGWKYSTTQSIPVASRYVHCVFGYGGDLDGWYLIGNYLYGNPIYSTDEPYSITDLISYTL